MTKTTHWILQILLTVVHGINLATNMIPDKYKPLAAAVVALIQAAIGIYNHDFTPSGAKIVGMILLMLLPVGVHAQAPPAPVDITTLFAVGTDALALHIGGQTVPAADAFAEFAPTDKLTLRSDSILAPSNNFQGYYARAKYALPLDALFAKTNLPKKTFQAYVSAGAGVVRSVPPTGPAVSKPSFLAGGGLKYDPVASGRFTITILDANYVNAAGFGPRPHGYSLMVGVKLNLWQKQ